MLHLIFLYLQHQKKMAIYVEYGGLILKITGL